MGLQQLRFIVLSYPICHKIDTVGEVIVQFQPVRLAVIIEYLVKSCVRPRGISEQRYGFNAGTLVLSQCNSQFSNQNRTITFMLIYVMPAQIREVLQQFSFRCSKYQAVPAAILAQNKPQLKCRVEQMHACRAFGRRKVANDQVALL